MRYFLKKILGIILRVISSISPFSFNAKALPGFDSINGKYVLPRNYDFLPLHIQREVNLGYVIQEKYIYKLNNVFISPGGIVFKNFKLFAPSVINEYVNSVLNYTFLLRQFITPAESLIEFKKDIIVVHDMWSQNYYHWMIDLLPKLLLLKDSDKESILIFPESKHEYMDFTLHAMGYHNIFIVKSDLFIKAKAVLLPERTAIGTYQNPELLMRVRELLISAINLTPIKNNRRIYVSRAKSQKRRVLNEQLLMPILQKYGFECVFFEDLSFNQQVDLMWNTQVLVGAHGANLVNILFMQQGSTLVELMNAGSTNLVYYRMSSTLKLPYYLLPCAVENISAFSDEDINVKNDLDIIVDLDLLERTLQNICV